MSKRTLDTFFSAAAAKKPRLEGEIAATNSISQAQTDPEAEPGEKLPVLYTTHPTYPFAIPHLPAHINAEVAHLVTASNGREMNDQPHLDLLYFQPFIPKCIERDLFNFLRSQLFFYRVRYMIKRFGKEMEVNTPRFTTVFGVDETSRFVSAAGGTDGPEKVELVEASSPARPVWREKYKSCTPRPIPECLDFLRRVTEAATDTAYNFCLVNYYASGSDSISFHSDDERFLGDNPAIASFTLGARRDFVMKHKPPKDSSQPKLDTKDIKLSLSSGDMVLMRGATQANWLHSIPKRKGAEADRGRINITFRRALVPAGTENYYRYNVGSGGVYKWNESKKEMIPWTSLSSS